MMEKYLFELFKTLCFYFTYILLDYLLTFGYYIRKYHCNDEICPPREQLKSLTFFRAAVSLTPNIGL